MLFVLTGSIQTGKTRWLEAMVERMRCAGVEVFGVIAPGVWADRRHDTERCEHVDENGFEKLGIDNVLLPSGERIPFARRTDLAIRESRFDPQAQSARAGLGWHIDEGALRRVDTHFAAMLPREAAGVDFETPAVHDEGPRLQSATGPVVLVVDELGRLELESGRGLVHALALLEAGPSCGFQHALIVVREGLLSRLDGRFPLWGPAILVSPDDESADMIMDAVQRG